MKTIIEPFRIKVVEALHMSTPEERQQVLEKAGHNLFLVKSEDVLIDLLTDSGTGAMSVDQWAGMIRGDESYACSPSYYRFRDTVRDIFGFKHVIPTHQGRAAERILFTVMCGPGQVVPNNTHFDTTRANIEYQGAQAVDLPIPEGLRPELHHPFKGNLDTDGLSKLIDSRGPDKIPLAMITVTNNSGGGQPVSIGNIRKAKEILQPHGIPLYLDACRFAENAYFIQQREPGYRDKAIPEIVGEMFSYADGCTMSAKKDGLANIGGFVCTNNDRLAEQERDLLILTEGFPTYGGLAGRDLEAIAVGLQEVLHEDYLAYRVTSTGYLGKRISTRGVPIVQPPGGHAVYIDAKAMLPHIPPLQYPGQALAAELYLEAGIRSVEIGSVMFGHSDPETGQEIAAPMELVRLAIPRRTYTQSHIDYVIEAVLAVFERRQSIRGLRMVHEAPFLRHFTARFERVSQKV